MPTINSTINLAANLLKSIGIDTPLLDSQLLLAHTLKISRFELQLMSREQLLGEQEKSFWQLIKRRLTFEPVAYILGEKEFFGLTFVVNRHCLIPRPDTEIIVEKCLSLLNNSRSWVFDICTGSGAIAIAIAKNMPNVNVVATDISLSALEVAQKNAINLEVSERVEFFNGDLFAAIPGKYPLADLVVSNPPYISSSSYGKLSCNVREFEPKSALDAGDEHGLSFYGKILQQAHLYVKNNGYLILEFGFDQATAVVNLVDNKWQVIEVFQDLANNDRGIILRKK